MTSGAPATDRRALRAGLLLSLRDLADVDRPWVWLGFLPLYFLPWLWIEPGPGDIRAAAAGIALFLPLYLLGLNSRRYGLVCAAGVLLVALALAPSSAAWPIIAVYASAMAGNLRPVGRGLAAVAAVTAACVAVAILLREPWYYLALSLVLVAMVGVAKVSRSRLQDNNAELLRTQELVRQLSRDSERQRVARDIHDFLGRTLTLVAVKADLARKLTPPEAEASRLQMQEVAQAAREGLKELRSVLDAVNAASLERELESARDALRAAGIAFESSGDPGRVSTNAAATLAMVLREAATNIIRHSRAGRCRIEIASKGGDHSISISDDGKGGRIEEGVGLSGMRSRVAAAGGSMIIVQRRPGLQILATVPEGEA